MNQNEDRFVRSREEIWLIARNLLKGSGCDYTPDDILSASIFLAGDAIEDTRVIITDSTGNTEIESEGQADGE